MERKLVAMISLCFRYMPKKKMITPPCPYGPLYASRARARATSRYAPASSSLSTTPPDR